MYRKKKFLETVYGFKRKELILTRCIRVRQSNKFLETRVKIEYFALYHESNINYTLNRECFNIRHTFHSSSTVTEKNPCLVDLVLTLMVDTTKDARRSRRSEIQVCKHRAAFDEIQSAYRFLLIANIGTYFFY